MATALENEVKIKKPAVSRQRRSMSLPTKRSINLIGVGEKPINVKIAAPAIILILLAAVLFSKFAVADRLAAVSRAQQEAARVQTRLDEAYAEMERYGELQEEFAHYTYSGMTAEELSLVDRAQVVDLIQRVILPKVSLGSWSVQGNQLTVSVTGETLETVNQLVQSLYEEELVDFCTVTTAAMNELTTNNTVVMNGDTVLRAQQTDVNASVTIFLKQPKEEAD